MCITNGKKKKKKNSFLSLTSFNKARKKQLSSVRSIQKTGCPSRQTIFLCALLFLTWGMFGYTEMTAS
jgi:hypothetical protein